MRTDSTYDWREIGEQVTAAAWPLAARAQQNHLPLVGVLRPNPKDIGETFAEPFRR